MGRHIGLQILGRRTSRRSADLAVLEVPEKFATEAGFRFFLLDHLCTNPQVGQVLTVCGFPYELARQAPPALAGSADGLLFPAGEHDGIIFPLIEQMVVVDEKPFTEAYDPQVHFLLRRQRHPEDDMPEDPAGLSGAGVWQDPPPVSMSSIWSPDRLDLAGVEVAWLPKSALMIVTRAEILLGMLNY